MNQSAQISPPQNGLFEPLYSPTEWNYDTEISLVYGHLRQKHNAKRSFLILFFCQYTNMLGGA